MKEIEAINNIMISCGMPHWGVCSFDDIKNELLECGAKKRLPDGAKSVITAFFPYFSSEKPGEISRYAAGADYHIIAGEMLKKAADEFRGVFNGKIFEPFCDSSPIPEVKAARLAGLGAVGKNGLLITPDYGSFVFIGEIVTDLYLTAEQNPGGDCNSCGICEKACPSGCLSSGKFDCEHCISHISQKKGELSTFEAALIRKAGTIWGCDICQNVCPMNRNIKETYIEPFKTDLIKTFTQGEIENKNFKKTYSNRAFMWRGRNVLKRNVGILHKAPENNIICNK